MLKADYQPYKLMFKTPGGTSRGVLTEKQSWFITIYDDAAPSKRGIGECSVLPKLSYDDRPGLKEKIEFVCKNADALRDDFHDELRDWPSLRFAVETALIGLSTPGSDILFPSAFTRGEHGIPINGLIWMGAPDYMLQQIEEKILAGFTCLKMKIGAIGFDEEYRILEALRRRFSKDQLELRVDANGAFSPAQAPGILDKLARLDIHSVEQPIRAGHWEEMAALCESSPIPIALDEELIGINDIEEKKQMMNTIRPQFIILKPSLTGGLKASEEWIQIAGDNGTGWWITSALESNIGLNAIAQWTYTLDNRMPQGLGTGQVFSNNVPSRLYTDKGHLWMHD
ncbi:o-succinylbenzoate synthase [Anaerophaga thermohalophila]|uniref:o-succinylbenzoate synthase n=1 Tax=Anaerophaga thermohalophila TaxID=177400 RepID=UPI000237BB02|nr:o-succinylbenzoate synthase [Anaerophaga thermohalophila]